MDCIGGVLEEVESFEYLGSLGFFDFVEKLPEPSGSGCTHLFCCLPTWFGEVDEANSLVVAFGIGSPDRPVLSGELVDEPADAAGFESEAVRELDLTERPVSCQLADRVCCGDRHRLPARCRVSSKDAEGVDEANELLTKIIARYVRHSCNLHPYTCTLQLSEEPTGFECSIAPSELTDLGLDDQERAATASRTESPTKTAPNTASNLRRTFG